MQDIKSANNKDNKCKASRVTSDNSTQQHHHHTMIIIPLRFALFSRSYEGPMYYWHAQAKHEMTIKALSFCQKWKTGSLLLLLLKRRRILASKNIPVETDVLLTVCKLGTL